MAMYKFNKSGTTEIFPSQLEKSGLPLVEGEWLFDGMPHQLKFNGHALVGGPKNAGQTMDLVPPGGGTFRAAELRTGGSSPVQGGKLPQLRSLLARARAAGLTEVVARLEAALVKEMAEEQAKLLAQKEAEQAQLLEELAALGL